MTLKDYVTRGYANQGSIADRVFIKVSLTHAGSGYKEFNTVDMNWWVHGRNNSFACTPDTPIFIAPHFCGGDVETDAECLLSGYCKRNIACNE